MTSTTNRDLCRFFYAATTDHYYACNYCGTRRKQLPSSGYANLLSHLKDKPPNYVEDFVAHQLSQAGSLSAFGFVNPTAANMYCWMAWVVDRNMPLSEGMIGVDMRGVCGAMYDGWTCNFEHYVALFGVFCKNGKLEQPLLAIAPMGEGDLTAPAHCAFITRVFEKYNQSLESLAF
ncbi:hypothetical protein PHYSODRAFT_471825 [Phytophthora sojae]|uniref:BED-type domain-containing protein n=1 Tax=Phytophthora sojae (strain P6497) TaxID=1094619 RepID=G4YR15_PHYSP|nr:hypothetical protein PHYSODRAFT_471825 [Phytophthora sojae]EGZ30695.1 hypothetical protein PHYSODRAFT_471825 [Phytophthora sojae]|eukprot:XP_009517970.1 hypothetical protein PHYSODRAFT_471825 [Phytophthora sojae]